MSPPSCMPMVGNIHHQTFPVRTGGLGRVGGGERHSQHQMSYMNNQQINLL